jgi:hypothetical protein
MTCTGSTTAAPGQYTNRGTACGDSTDGQTVSDDDPSNHFGAGPDPDPDSDSAIAIEKWTRIVDSGSEGNLCGTFEKPKQLTMLFTGGNGSPDDRSDDFNPTLVSGDGNVDNLLDLDETWIYQAAGEVKPGQCGNLGDVSGVGPDGATVTDQDPNHYFGVCPTRPGHDRDHRKSRDTCGATDDRDKDDDSVGYNTHSLYLEVIEIGISQVGKSASVGHRNGDPAHLRCKHR